MNKEEFEQGYIKRCGRTEAWFSKYKITLYCNCHEKDCHGWAVVNNSPESIVMHNQECEQRDSRGFKSYWPKTTLRERGYAITINEETGMFDPIPDTPLPGRNR